MDVFAPSYDISIDTETTGFDLHHSARPFIVVSGRFVDGVTIWEWDVDPLTRQPVIPKGDTKEILDLIFPKRNKPGLILHNSKFDVAALKTIIPDLHWPWDRTNDTLVASHLLDSNKPKNLTDFTSRILGKDIFPYEKRVKEACQAARRYARSKYKDWLIAKEGLEDMPSIKEESWKADMWLPRALWKHDDTIKNRNPSWETVTAEYAETDATVTAALWPRAKKMIQERDVWEHYLGKMKCMELAHRMEMKGTTINITTLQGQRGEYAETSMELGQRCQGIARTYGFELELPKSGMNKSLNEFLFTPAGMNLKPVVLTDTGNPSFNKQAIEVYLNTLPEGRKQRRFVELIAEKKKCDTAIGYMDAYEKFAIPDGDEPDYVLIHPSVNPCGTNVTRWTSANPNEQSIGKQKGFNVRKPFGPKPDREWWPMDYSNLELRIPVYECEEMFLLNLFEKPDEPPFFGSNHLVNFSIVYPDLWEDAMKRFGPKEAGEWVKSDKGYKSTYYKWAKNGWFAIQYGAMLQENGWGTADLAFHKQGAHAQLFSRLNKLGDLSQSLIRFANKHGYVETIPVKGRNRGFPVSVQRMSHGGVLPTTPMSYHVQGTAGEAMDRAMIRCQEKLDEWYNTTGFDGFITMMIHDELVFDFPKSKVHPKEIKEGDSMFRTGRSNLWRARVLQSLMAKSGDDLNPRVPTPVSLTYCEKSWGDELAI